MSDESRKWINNKESINENNESEDTIYDLSSSDVFDYSED